MPVTYLPGTQAIEDELVRQNFEFIESQVLFKTVPAPAVTGSKAGNAALASLISQLAAQGLVTDRTT